MRKVVGFTLLQTTVAVCAACVIPPRLKERGPRKEDNSFISLHY